MLTFLPLALSLLAAEPADESITVTIVGKVQTGVVAIGGETTGVTITAKDIKWELAFDKHPELKAEAENLNGQLATVTGALERRRGIEIKERWLVTVTSLKKR